MVSTKRYGFHLKDSLQTRIASEAVAQRCSVKNVFSRFSQNSQEDTCARVSFLINCRPEACNFVKKETLVQVLSCEFCEIFKDTFLTEHLCATASVASTKKNEFQ